MKGASRNKKRDVARWKRQLPNELVHPVLVSIQLAFSGWHVLAKVALNEGVNPMALALEREVFATLLMWAMARHVEGPQVMERQDRLRFIALGVFSFTNVVGAILALKLTSPTMVALMQPSIPVFAMILSYIYGIERMSKLKAFGVILAVSGALWVEWSSIAASGNSQGGDAAADGGGKEGDSGPGGTALLGAGVLFVQCLGMAALTVAQRPVLSKYPSMTVTAWYYAAGSACTLLACMVTGVSMEDLMLTRSREPWLALAYVTVFATFYTYNAYSWALTIVPPTTTTVYSTLQPVTTAALAFIFLALPVTEIQVLGGGVIVIGLLVTSYAKAREHRAQARQAREDIREDLTAFFNFRRGNRRRSSSTNGRSLLGSITSDEEDLSSLS
eukprot:TRINITY_DN7914_c0_g1_i4.p1 TRINITY_DN7914_c0_g1~~TRINITY_DN7914_c0_g1_i4.p1  ORF type:complete len:408 (-),score=57.60 TRINITY_DN7914_c0_g1_i4:22-1185(-)